MFTENIDYKIYRHDVNESNEYGLDDLARLSVKLLKEDWTDIRRLRELHPVDTSATRGDNVNIAFCASLGDDEVETKFQKFATKKIADFGKEVLGKTGTVKYNNFWYTRMGESSTIISHQHPELNDGICVMYLEVIGNDAEVMLAKDGPFFRYKEDIPENECVTLYLKTGDMFLFKPKLHHLAPPLKEGSQAIFLVLNFYFEQDE